MTFVRSSSTLISWISTGKLQQTVANCVEVTGIGLHSGKVSTVRICPELAGEGRYFELGSKVIQASIDFAKESPLCTTLCKDGHSISTVEHLLSALEATGVDNCRLEVETSDPHHPFSFEVPILDGSAREWVEAIEEAGLKASLDRSGKSREKLARVLTEPITAWRNDSFIAAFPYSKVKITYGIDFLQVEQLRKSGLIKGGSTENAIVCSESRGWLNPPLRFSDEPCRHKVLDLMGDLSLLAQGGNQGLPVAHIIVYKGGHALHTDFARCLSRVK
ncbi:probable UDP-3-O-acyl-N-acetylglucosamine deacetylase 1, mitochondrial isoform X2 [Nicotiana sylvestris]|uniref:probable UDP-3-O-acyl-N-acetylglucosamine deacetylase 1, mitochondrial isoform X2 n=1 Tax=Nicotiana sylvestris TaxID=4096 RepID=UPI00388C5598